MSLLLCYGCGSAVTANVNVLVIGDPRALFGGDVLADLLQGAAHMTSRPTRLKTAPNDAADVPCHLTTLATISNQHHYAIPGDVTWERLRRPSSTACSCKDRNHLRLHVLYRDDSSPISQQHTHFAGAGILLFKPAIQRILSTTKFTGPSVHAPRLTPGADPSLACSVS